MPKRLLGVAVAVAAAALLVTPSGNAVAAPRLVTLTPFTANTVAELGVRPVAVGQLLGGQDRLSPRLGGLPLIPLTHPNGPNLEHLATLNARLILSARVWRRGHAGMRRLGMRVVESDPTSVAAVPRETRRIGALLGRTRHADQIARQQERDIAAAKRGIRRHPRVLLLLGVGRTPYAFLANSWGGDVVRQAGGRLLTDGLRASGGYARISNETVVARNPDIIIAVPHGNPKDLPRLAGYLRSNPAWRSTRAARTGRVYLATGNSLLQAFTDAGRIIRDVRTKFLRN